MKASEGYCLIVALWPPITEAVAAGSSTPTPPIALPGAMPPVARRCGLAAVAVEAAATTNTASSARAAKSVLVRR